MGAKIWGPLVASLVVGLAAALLAARVLKAPHTQRQGDSAAVVVAAHDIDPGTELTALDLTTIKYPAGAAPPDAVTDPHSLVGRVTVAPILRGQLAGDRLLAAIGTPAGLQSLVPNGMRAITLEVNEFSGVGGMLVPGERVDVIANVRNEETKELSARTIVQDLEILAVGRSLAGAPAQSNANPAPTPTNATLLVTPRQAQAIQLVSQGARPWLVLRGYRDGKTANPGTTEMAELRGELPGTAVKKVAATRPAPDPVTPVVAAPATQPAVQTVEMRQPVQPKPMRVVRLIFGDKEQKQTYAVEEPDTVLASPDTNYAIPR